MITSPNLPVHICKEAQADEVYDKHAGTELLGVSTCVMFVFVHIALIGSFSNDDGDENVKKKKKSIVLITKTTTLHVCYTFWYISLPSLHD